MSQWWSRRDSGNITYGELWPEDPEFSSMVHPHWHSFRPPDPIHNYLAGAYIGIIGLTGVFENLLVIVLFTLDPVLRTPTNLLILNLAVSDLIFSAVNGFPLKTLAAFNQRWPWGRQACRIYGFVGGFFGFLSLTTLAFIALERYIVIVRPFGTLASLSYCRVTGMLLTIWIWSLIWSIAPFFGYGNYIPEGFHTSCTFDYLSTDWGNVLFNAGMYIFGFLMPVLMLVLSYWKIVLKSRRSKLNLFNLSRSEAREDSSGVICVNHNNDLKAARTSAILVLLYMISWCPYAMIALVALCGCREYLTPLLAELPVLFAKTSAFYNPLVYALMHEKFRNQLARRINLLKNIYSKTSRKRTTGETPDDERDDETPNRARLDQNPISPPVQEL